MTCRSCSATIDDKAIVCYRCGTPTADPATLKPRAAAGGGGSARLWIVVVLVVVAVAIYFYSRQP